MSDLDVKYPSDRLSGDIQRTGNIPSGKDLEYNIVSTFVFFLH